MSSRTAMEVTTSPWGKLYPSAAQVRRLCPKMAFTANALRKVDFPEALEPVSSTSFSSFPLFATGLWSSGWNRPVHSNALPAENAGGHQAGSVTRNDKVETAASTSPTVSKRRRSSWGWAWIDSIALRYRRKSRRVRMWKYSCNSSNSEEPRGPSTASRPFMPWKAWDACLNFC